MIDRKLLMPEKCADCPITTSLRTLLDWCERFLIDDKHLIGSICKEADDAQFRFAIESAKRALGSN